MRGAEQETTHGHISTWGRRTAGCVHGRKRNSPWPSNAENTFVGASDKVSRGDGTMNDHLVCTGSYVAFEKKHSQSAALWSMVQGVKWSLLLVGLPLVHLGDAFFGRAMEIHAWGPAIRGTKTPFGRSRRLMAEVRMPVLCPAASVGAFLCER